MAYESNIQKIIDGLIDKVFLRFIPKEVKPNHITIIRFLLIPIVFSLLQTDKFGLALVVFIIAASTDFIDGAMARTRNQITDIGKIIDPIADKLLILSVILSIGLGYLVVKIVIVAIVLELFAIIISVNFANIFGKPIGANIYGKIKMIFQSIGVGVLILGLLFNNTLLINISEFMLLIALIFATLSGLGHIIYRLRRT